MKWVDGELQRNRAIPVVMDIGLAIGDSDRFGSRQAFRRQLRVHPGYRWMLAGFFAWLADLECWSNRENNC